MKQLATSRIIEEQIINYIANMIAKKTPKSMGFDTNDWFIVSTPDVITFSIQIETIITYAAKKLTISETIKYSYHKLKKLKRRIKKHPLVKQYINQLKIKKILEEPLIC